jgi:sugar fermentation stimulation protein A
VNTATPNSIVRETLLSIVGKNSSGTFAHWADFHEVKPEYKISKETRLDFALKKNNSDKFHFIEVKNVTLADADVAQFPDAVSERAQKHVRELMELMDQGHTAELIFTVQRNDCTKFSPADSIDPEYGKLLREAVAKGLRVTPLLVNLSPDAVELSETLLPLHL